MTFLRYLMLIMFAATVVVRYEYARDLPLSGDEAGVGILQATGHWEHFTDSLPVNRIVDVQSVKRYLTYSPEKTAWDVIRTMRADRLHPPLYFVLLHGVIRVGGDSPAALRMLSIVLSLLSVFAIYLLGKELFGEYTGLAAAFLMMLSAYCLEYSIMVRLYPLAMCLSLFSSWLAVKLARTRTFHLRNGWVYLYILVAAAGLYTYYSFAVLLVTQFLSIAFTRRWDLRFHAGAMAVYVTIFLLLVPWILPMLQGIDAVRTKDYYFTGTYTLFTFFDYFHGMLSVPFRPWLAGAGKVPALATVIVSGLAAAGILLRLVWESRRTWSQLSFILSVMLYFVIFILTDILFGTRMMTFDRQHYFTVPAMILLLAAGIISLPRKVLRIPALALIAGLFLTGGIYRFTHRSVFDGPYYFRQLLVYLEDRTEGTRDKENLILFNARDKRYLLPFIYHESKNFDLAVLPAGINDSIEQGLGVITGYRNIFLVNVDVTPRKKQRLNLHIVDAEKTGIWLRGAGFLQSGEPWAYEEEEKLTIHRFTRNHLQGT